MEEATTEQTCSLKRFLEMPVICCAASSPLISIIASNDPSSTQQHRGSPKQRGAFAAIPV